MLTLFLHIFFLYDIKKLFVNTSFVFLSNLRKRNFELLLRIGTIEVIIVLILRYNLKCVLLTYDVHTGLTGLLAILRFIGCP